MHALDILDGVDEEADNIIPMFQQPSQDDIKQMYDVRERYINTDQWMKAPNGNPTNLTEQQWLQVRTPAFKKWFRDWEKAQRIEKLKEAESVIVTGHEIFSNDEIARAEADELKRNAGLWKSLRKKARQAGLLIRGDYYTQDGKRVQVVRDSIIEVSEHDYKNLDHLQSVVAIPQIIENGTFIDTLANEHKENKRIESFDYYVSGLNIDGNDYIVRFVLSKSKDETRCYDHKLTTIEKGELLNLVSELSTSALQVNSPFSTFNARRLFSILQDSASKVVDENGEPLVVYHGTPNTFTVFKPNDAPGWGTGIYCTDNPESASDFADGSGGNILPLFVHIRNPYTGQSLGVDLEDTETYKRYNERNHSGDDLDPDTLWSEDGEFVNQVLRELGYDGIMTEGSNGIDGLEVVAFEPTQIKSIDNRGTWDPNNPNYLVPSLLRGRAY